MEATADHDYAASYNKWLKDESEKEGVVRDLFTEFALAFPFQEFSFEGVSYFAPLIHALGLRRQSPGTFISPCRDPPPQVRVLTSPVDPGDVQNESSVCSFPSAPCKFCAYNIMPSCGPCFAVDTPQDFASHVDAAFKASRRITRREDFDKEVKQLWVFYVRMAVDFVREDCLR